MSGIAGAGGASVPDMRDAANPGGAATPGVSGASAPVLCERWMYWVLAALLALLWLATLSARPLFNPDEGRYAEIPREMLSSGDWIVPHLNGLAYIEKPPLQYWATALSYRVFGVSAFAARLYCALCALGNLVLVWIAARRLWGLEAGWRAAAALCGMLMFVVLGQLLTLDMSLTFYLTLSLTAFLLAQRAAQPRRWMLLAWAAAGCGVLTKGLVAAVIPAAVLLLYSAYSRDFAPWRRLYARWGMPLFLCITVPWHWLAARRLTDFLQFFFVHEHLARYLSPVADRQEPWWFFIGVFLAGSVPWTLPALRVMGGAWRLGGDGGRLGGGRGWLGGRWRGAPPAAFNPALFLWIWVAFIGVFYSLSDSKLMPYILPGHAGAGAAHGDAAGTAAAARFSGHGGADLDRGVGFGIGEPGLAASRGFLGSQRVLSAAGEIGGADRAAARRFRRLRARALRARCDARRGFPGRRLVHGLADADPRRGLGGTHLLGGGSGGRAPFRGARCAHL